MDKGDVAFQILLPEPAPVHHLGLFREKVTLQPVEYYNNLPTRVLSSNGDVPCDIAIVLDPVIATGGTAEAAIQTLREWGVPNVCYLLLTFRLLHC
jgi:uracil phosphoribosyltransferase